MGKYVNEVLKEINDDPSLLESTYKKNGVNSPLEIIFKHAFIKEEKFNLPGPGVPPYKASVQPLGLSPTNIRSELKKFALFKRPDVSRTKREQFFIEMLEGVHPEEAKVLIAIKDQNLTNLYPNITAKVVACAGYIPILPWMVNETKVTATIMPSEEPPKKVGRSRGRPRKNPSPQAEVTI